MMTTSWNIERRGAAAERPDCPQASAAYKGAYERRVILMSSPAFNLFGLLIPGHAFVGEGVKGADRRQLQT